MKKYAVSVTVTATTTYEIEVEADDESQAEDLATSPYMVTANTSDFDVDLGDCKYETEVTQIAFDCDDCSASITDAQYRSFDGLCVGCNARHNQEEIDYWNKNPQRIFISSNCALNAAVLAGREVFDPISQKLWKINGGLA